MRYKSETEREDCDIVDDPNLQAVFRMRRSEQWSLEDTAHRAGGLPMAHPQQEAIYGINPDDWKDLTEAVKKVRDGRGIYLACQPADVFQEWFLALGTAKIKERT